MNRKIGTIITILLLGYSTVVRADRGFVNRDQCQTDFDKNRTFLTIYGDSLGDFVDHPWYGFIGWENYLTIHRPEIEWDVQNLATAGHTTLGLYRLLKDCARSEATRAAFQTADNVAFEIGGNDYKDNALLFMYAPWRGNDIVNRVTFNQEIIMRMLNLRDKRVLVMGNFPTIAKSPMLGDISDYFKPFKYQVNGTILNANNLTAEKAEDDRRQVAEQIRAGLELPVRLILDIGGWLWNSIFSADIPADYLKYANGSPACTSWYLCWYFEHRKNPISHAMSMLMFMGQPVLAEKAKNQGAEFIDLYPFFIRHYDCRYWGQCWVANPDLFADQIHINHYGYFLWSGLLSAKIDELDWQNTLPNDKYFVKEPISGEPNAPEVGVQANPIDFVIFCFLIGKCG